MSYAEHKDSPLEHFLSICPRSKKWIDETYNYDIEDFPLRVVRSDDVEVDEGFNLTSTALNADDDGIVRKHYTNRGYSGLVFKVTCAFSVKDGINAHVNKTVKSAQTSDGVNNWLAGMNKHGNIVTNYVYTIDMVHYFAMHSTVLNVTTMAVDVPDGLYIIKDIKSKKQTYEGFTVWELEFESYLPAKKLTFQNTNTGVTKALNSYKANKEIKKVTQQIDDLFKTSKAMFDSKTVGGSIFALANKNNASGTVVGDKLYDTVKKTMNEMEWKDCSLKEIQYSKTKKTTKCVEYMQKALHKKGYIKDKKDIDGWYGKATAKAVKKFQSDYAKKYKLQVNGVVDKETLKVLKKI